MSLPLSGIRVLDFSRLLPGPFCSMLLADYGAEVIKIEDPASGDYLREVPPLVNGTGAYFQALNRNKKSLSLDLKAREGVEIVHSLAQTADVVLETFRPGVADRLGIGHEALRQVNSRLVYCSLTGYGQTGPYRERSGHDLNYLALAGALDQFAAAPEALPILPGLQLADMAGAMYAAFGIAMALQERERTGTGRYLDVAMLDGVLSWLPFAAARTHLQGHAPRVGETELTGATARYAVYRTSDERSVALAALETKFWQRFCEASGHLEWLTTTEALLKHELSMFFAKKTQAEWIAWAEGKDLCLEPVLALHETLAHPQVRARGMAQPPGLGPVIPLAGAGPHSPVPGLGEHTTAILGGLGMNEDEQKVLRDRGVT